MPRRRRDPDMPPNLGPPGCPYDPGAIDVSSRPIDVRTVTLHRTIGSWPGDYSVGKTRNLNQGTFQYLIGQAPGEWVQFYACDRFSSHAAGANNAGPGIELSGQNGEPLTDWQIDALGQVMRWLRDTWGVLEQYVDGDPREWIDNVGARGFVSHRHVAYPPDTSYQHYDYIELDEWQRAMRPVPPAPPPPPLGGKDMIVGYQSGNVGFFAIIDGVKVGPLDPADYGRVVSAPGAVNLGVMTDGFDTVVHADDRTVRLV